MLYNILIVSIPVLVLLILCWMLTEYWLRSVRKLSREKISNLSIWNRMVFTLEDFCGAVNRKKNFRTMKAEDELSSVSLDIEEGTHTVVHDVQKQGKEKENAKKDKRYNIKVNM